MGGIKFEASSSLFMGHPLRLESRILWEVSHCIGIAPSIFLSTAAMLGSVISRPVSNRRVM